jgi:hypothetical protein
MPGILPFDSISGSVAPATGRRTFREADFPSREVAHMQGKARSFVLQPEHPRYSTTARVPPPPSYGPPATGGATAPETSTSRKHFANLFNTGSHQQNPMSASGETQRWPPPERVEPVSAEADFLHRAWASSCSAPPQKRAARATTFRSFFVNAPSTAPFPHLFSPQRTATSAARRRRATPPPW